MSRLVVVSNRVADLSANVQSGGLAVALEDALREAHGVWFGWDGDIVDDVSPLGIKLAQFDRVRTATVPLTQQEYDEYYLGFSNKVLRRFITGLTLASSTIASLRAIGGSTSASPNSLPPCWSRTTRSGSTTTS